VKALKDGLQDITKDVTSLAGQNRIMRLRITSGNTGDGCQRQGRARRNDFRGGTFAALHRLCIRTHTRVDAPLA